MTDTLFLQELKLTDALVVLFLGKQGKRRRSKLNLKRKLFRKKPTTEDEDMVQQGYLDRVFVPYSRLSQVFWLCTNKSPSPQSESALGWGVILEMPRIGFTRVREAWCRVPKSPREGREVTGVMFRVMVEGRNTSGVRAWLATVARWRVSPRLVGDCGESVRAWLATVSIERCGRCVASQSALGWGDSLLSFAGRCSGESVCTWLARLSLGGESVLAWLGRLATERCGPLLWRVSPRLDGETVARWRVSPRLVGNCPY
ncbi:hypothetical protein ACLB2K_053344 [Fragaria x ananassa]